jgi:hypothetical protein
VTNKIEAVGVKIFLLTTERTSTVDAPLSRTMQTLTVSEMSALTIWFLEQSNRVTPTFRLQIKRLWQLLYSCSGIGVSTPMSEVVTRYQSLASKKDKIRFYFELPLDGVIELLEFFQEEDDFIHFADEFFRHRLPKRC